jgi:hypothetical protein
MCEVGEGDASCGMKWMNDVDGEMREGRCFDVTKMGELHFGFGD